MTGWNPAHIVFRHRETVLISYKNRTIGISSIGFCGFSCRIFIISNSCIFDADCFSNINYTVVARTVRICETIYWTFKYFFKIILIIENFSKGIIIIKPDHCRMCTCMDSNIMSFIKLRPFLLRNSYGRVNNTCIKIKGCFKIKFVKKLYKSSVLNFTIIITESKNFEFATWEYLIYFIHSCCLHII